MVGLIVKPELPEKDIDLSDDKDVDRYYYYISNGVDTIHTAGIDEESVRAILVLVPENLHDRFPDFSNNLMTEIKEDFTKNMKRAIVKFALTDRSKEYLLKVVSREETECELSRIKNKVAKLNSTNCDWNFIWFSKPKFLNNIISTQISQ